MIERDKQQFQGGCSCGWRGTWRFTDMDAHEDIRVHRLETGHEPSDAEPFDDSLMPHERRRLRKT